jgi:hypothetical protein
MKVMKKLNAVTLKYVGIGFSCLVIALASLRALDLQEIAPVAVGAVMLSVLIASTAEARKA